MVEDYIIIYIYIYWSNISGLVKYQKLSHFSVHQIMLFSLGGSTFFSVDSPYLVGGLNPTPLKNDGVKVNGKDEIPYITHRIHVCYI